MRICRCLNTVCILMFVILISAIILIFECIFLIHRLTKKTRKMFYPIMYIEEVFLTLPILILSAFSYLVLGRWFLYSKRLLIVKCFLLWLRQYWPHLVISDSKSAIYLKVLESEAIYIELICSLGSLTERIPYILLIVRGPSYTLGRLPCFFEIGNPLFLYCDNTDCII